MGIGGARVAMGGRSALEMIADCFRHQHPEAFGRSPVAAPVLPIEVRYGRDEAPPSPPNTFTAEEAMGHPAAVALQREAALAGESTWAA